MRFEFDPQGVCSTHMSVEVDQDGIVREFEAEGGCSGNLQGIGALVQGMPAQEVISRLKGIRCGGGETSCPDQFACHLERLLNETK